MKTLFYTAALLPFVAMTATAGDITIFVSDLVQIPSALPERCYVVMRVENMSQDTIDMTVELGPQYKAGSASSMIAPAGNAFGNKDILNYSNIEPNSWVIEEEDLLGATCSEITSISIRPQCVNKTTPGADCQGEIVRSPDSVIGVSTEADPTLIGGLVDTGPKGPLHGEWIIANGTAEPMFTLNINQPIDELGSGIFSSHPALCAVIKQPQDCAQGQVVDKDLRYVSHNGDGVLIQAHATADSVDNFNLMWSLSAGAGNLGNINSASLAPFTAVKSE